jgi:hypothetical protein
MRWRGGYVDQLYVYLMKSDMRSSSFSTRIKGEITCPGLPANVSFAPEVEAGRTKVIAYLTCDGRAKMVM